MRYLLSAILNTARPSLRMLALPMAPRYDLARAALCQNRSQAVSHRWPLRQFAVPDRAWRVAAFFAGKLKIGGIVDAKAEVIGEVQRIRPSVGICLLVSLDVQESKISERGAAEIQASVAELSSIRMLTGDLRRGRLSILTSQKGQLSTARRARGCGARRHGLPRG